MRLVKKIKKIKREAFVIYLNYYMYICATL